MKIKADEFFGGRTYYLDEIHVHETSYPEDNTWTATTTAKEVGI